MVESGKPPTSARGAVTTLPEEIQCKGSLMLGTGCGHCVRCQAELPKILKLFAWYQEQMNLLRIYAPQEVQHSFTGQKYDATDDFKAKCFDELRAVIYRKPPEL